MSLLPNYNRFFAAGLGTPYARQWVPAPPYQGVDKLLSVPPIKNLAFWHVQVRVLGEIYLPVELVEPWLNKPDATNPPLIPGENVALDAYTTLQAVDQVSHLTGLARMSSSILKVRLLWKDWVGERCLDFDLGAGVDIILPPSHYVQAQLLLPVAGSELQLPPRLADNPLGFGTMVVARADCVQGTVERNDNVVFTDTVYLDRNGAAGESVFIPRRKDSNRYEVTGSTDPLGATESLWDRNPPGQVADLLGRFTNGQSLPVPTGIGRGSTTQTRLVIPGGTNAFRHTLPITVNEMTVCLLQELSF